MKLTGQQQQTLNAMGITQWVLRGNIQHTETSEIQSVDDNSADTAAEISVEPSQESEKKSVTWLILLKETEAPDWWQGFLALFADDFMVAENDHGIKYKYLLIFSDTYSHVQLLDANRVAAPALASFDNQLKRQLWMMIKPWLNQ